MSHDVHHCVVTKWWSKKVFFEFGTAYIVIHHMTTLRCPVINCTHFDCLNDSLIHIFINFLFFIILRIKKKSSTHPSYKAPPYKVPENTIISCDYISMRNIPTTHFCHYYFLFILSMWVYSIIRVVQITYNQFIFHHRIQSNFIYIPNIKQMNWK